MLKHELFLQAHFVRGQANRTLRHAFQKTVDFSGFLLIRTLLIYRHMSLDSKRKLVFQLILSHTVHFNIRGRAMFGR